MTGLAATLRVPLDRLRNPDGENLNVGIHHTDVQVRINPTLPYRGLTEHHYGGPVVSLREWNEQVLLHELLHVVLDPLRLATDDDPHLHNVIARVEVALWETGWRMTTPAPPAQQGPQPRESGE